MEILREILNFLSKNILNVTILLMSISFILFFTQKNRNDKKKVEDLFSLYSQKNEHEELKIRKDEQCEKSSEVCFLNGNNQTLKLNKIIKLTNTVKIFIFSYPSKYSHFGLDICKHIKFNLPNREGKIKGKWNDKLDRENDSKEIFRSYTPIYVDKKNKLVHFVIRIYNPDEKYIDGGKMSIQLNKMHNNDNVKIAGPFGLLDYKGNNEFSYLSKSLKNKKHIVMIAGGTGMTPFFRLIKHLLLFDTKETETNHPFITFIYANRNEEEILLKPVFDEYEKRFERFKIVYSVDECIDDSKKVSMNNIGYLNVEILRMYILKYQKLNVQIEKSDTLILMCGPPPMTAFLKKLLNEDIKMENVITV
ncbi:oxidoreductase NAD-binding domain containing protein [Plasmodium gonderi]|uniref:Oxidoreductase NAD-binding domain containing protein n=1 Tax=Plasmodium gonderi TaxID=77519 RepID=A0A1Y1JMG4_PLAGO|nr:oxidoreductase NAD-binding domain containing protein [Plasmodium gonderi]GAW81583.1 oxidoreductase NAD-binding domain containing protein [Plasmodium gonderi]